MSDATPHPSAASTHVEPRAQSAKPSVLMNILVSLAVLLIGGAGAYAFYGRSESKPVESAAVAKKDETPPDPNLVKLDEKQKGVVTVQTVETKKFQVENTCTGRIAFNDELTTPVFAEFTGRIVKVFVKPGDTVQKGAPLYEIDTPDLVQIEADLITAVSSLRKAENAARLSKQSALIAQHNIDIAARSVKLARDNEARQKQGLEDHAVAAKDYEQAQRDVQQALRDGEQAQKDLDQAHSDQKAAESDIFAGEHILNASRERLRVFGKSDAEIEKIQAERVLDRVTTIKAPVTGTVTTRKINQGQYVKTDNPDPLFTISDLARMWLVADVHEVDVPKMALGQTVEVRVLAFPDEVFTAKVSYISPAVSPDARRLTVRCDIPNPDRKLKSEMFANFKILTGEATPSPAVPPVAIVREKNSDVVYVAKSDLEFEKRLVTTGSTQNQLVQILSGLKAGDRVVTDGAVFLNNSDSK